MTTSTTIYNRAVELFEQNMNGERENPKFKKFKQALQDNGVALDSSKLIAIYDDITPSGTFAISENNSSYVFAKEYGRNIAKCAAVTIFDTLTETPTSAMDIVNNALFSARYFCAQYTDKAKGFSRDYILDLYDAIVRLIRRTLQQLADEGLVKVTPIYTCGKLYIRLYSLA